VSILFLVTSAASAQESDARVAQGQRLFEAHGCYGCHAIAGTGGKTAPDLSNVGHRAAGSSTCRQSRWPDPSCRPSPPTSIPSADRAGRRAPCRRAFRARQVD